MGEIIGFRIVEKGQHGLLQGLGAAERRVSAARASKVPVVSLTAASDATGQWETRSARLPA